MLTKEEITKRAQINMKEMTCMLNKKIMANALIPYDGTNSHTLDTKHRAKYINLAQFTRMRKNIQQDLMILDKKYKNR